MNKPTTHKQSPKETSLFKQDLESIFDGINEMITIHDSDFNIIYANETAKKILRLPSLNGKNIKCYKYYHGQDSPPDSCPSCTCVKTLKPVVVERFEPYLNLFIEIKAIPQIDSSNQHIRLIHITRDITEHRLAAEELQKHRTELMKLVEERTDELSISNEFLRQEILDRKLAEHALKISEQKYRNLYDNAPDMYHTLNKNKIIIDCNETEARMLGYTKEEIIGRPLTDFFTEESKKKFEKDSPRLKKEKVLRNIERTFIRKDGTTFPAIVNVYAELDSRGEIYEIRAISRDITERKRAETEAMRTAHLVALGELAAGVAHEINNPINGIINYAQILLNKNQPGSKDHDIAKRIIKESDRIAGIVGNLLSFARYSNEEMRLVHIHEIMSDALGLTNAQLTKDAIRLQVTIPTDLSALEVIPEQIEQVFLNIISNARYALNEKYASAHENKILKITGKQVTVNNSHYIRIEFYDKGTGISPDNMNEVINPFFSTKPANIGTGLGLSISHGIITNHGGKLLIDSVEGEFTRVIIDLPLSVTP